MTIKQVEEILNIPKATIRFYEKEGLLHPERTANGYRNYSDGDVEILRRIIIFRKIGMSVDMILDLQDDAISLQKALEENVKNLEKQMAELNGAMIICNELKNKQVDMEHFDNDVWWDRIHNEEKKGLRFVDLAADILQFYGEEIEKDLGLRKEDEKKPIQWKYILGIELAALALYSLIVVFIFKDTLQSALEVVVEVGILDLLILLPKYFLKKKSDEAAKLYTKIISAVAIVLVLGVILLVMVLMVNSKLHFWF